MKKNMRLQELRPLDASAARSTPHRMELVTVKQQFYYDGDDELAPGRWAVCGVRGNCYVCKRLTGQGTETNEEFDIGFVMRSCTSMCERIRERGPRS